MRRCTPDSDVPLILTNGIQICGSTDLYLASKNSSANVGFNSSSSVPDVVQPLQEFFWDLFEQRVILAGGRGLDCLDDGAG